MSLNSTYTLPFRMWKVSIIQTLRKAHHGLDHSYWQHTPLLEDHHGMLYGMKDLKIKCGHISKTSVTLSLVGGLLKQRYQRITSIDISKKSWALRAGVLALLIGILKLLMSVTIDSPDPWWQRGTTHIHATLRHASPYLVRWSSLVDHTCNGYDRCPFTLVVLLVLRVAPLL